ncbi:MAG: HAMP domain-containing protein, partial [Pseudomonadota bacterium]|nr:HAMP domain-containing protein [Pseudomonadota bacterium]
MPAAGGLGGSGLRLPLLLLLGVLVLLGLLVSLFDADSAWRTQISAFQLGLIVTAAGLTLFLEGRIRRNLLEPLGHLRDWARRMRAGNLTARVDEPEAGAFRELARDVNGLGEMVSGLSLEMEERVQKATRRIAHKTRSLEILCDVASTINTSRDLNQLLKKFLEIVSEVVEARGGLVRLLTRDGQLRLVASEGLDEEIVDRERLVAV